MSFQVLPNFAIAPHCQRTYFLQLFSAGKFERFNELKVRPRWGLFAAKTGDPSVVGRKAFKQRRHFAESTAAVRSGLIQDAELRFLVGDALLRA